MYSIGTDDVILDNEDYGIVRTLAEQYIALIKSAQRIGPYYLGTGKSISFCLSGFVYQLFDCCYRCSILCLRVFLPSFQLGFRSGAYCATKSPAR